MPTLEITTNIGCPVKCTFCPQDALLKAYPKEASKLLTPLDFGRVLAKLPGWVRIDFSGFAEPWANPNCTDMLAAALKQGRSVAIYTTLVGMTGWDAETTIGLLRQHAQQVEVLCLHLPDANGHMRGLRLPSRAWESALHAFLDLEREGVIERFEKMTMDVDRLPSALVPAQRLLPWRGNDRAGSLDRRRVLPVTVEQPVHHDGPVTCSFTPFFDQNVMLPNGDVALCCMDYGLKHVLGNLFRQSYEELFAGPAMGELRARNMRYGPTGTICRQCTRAETYDLKPGRLQTWERQ